MSEKEIEELLQTLVDNGFEEDKKLHFVNTHPKFKENHIRLDFSGSSMVFESWQYFPNDFKEVVENVEFKEVATPELLQQWMRNNLLHINKHKQSGRFATKH